MITPADWSEPCVTYLQILDMPAAILIIIMRRLPLKERLGVCTRVCHAFYTAAVAATDSISITRISRQTQRDNVSEWLQLYGGGITCLDIQCGHGPSLACLPCPALRDLNLPELSVQPGFFSACTNLTRLQLFCRFVQSSPHASSSAAGGNPLTQLSVLCSLQHLELKNVRSPPSNSCCGFSGSLLSQLVQLTCLKLQAAYYHVLPDAALQHLSALSALQHLELNLQGRYEPSEKPTAAALTGLQQLPQLTALKISGVRWAINLHSMPAFTVLTALRVLQLEQGTSVDPAVLATISQLQHLELVYVSSWDAEGSAVLLAAVGQQQELVKLAISHHTCWSTPSAAAYSALTASSHLQHMQLGGCQFPAGAWQQMFPPTRCLPELSRILLYTHEGPVQPVSQADVQAMVSCCPSLVSLSLVQKLAVSSATPLLQLTGLTTLKLCTSFQDSAPSIAQLTRLQDLVLITSGQADQVTVSGLLQLTALQQLRSFFVSVAAGPCEREPRRLWSLGINDSTLLVSNTVSMSSASPACLWRDTITPTGPVGNNTRSSTVILACWDIFISSSVHQCIPWDHLAHWWVQGNPHRLIHVSCPCLCVMLHPSRPLRVLLLMCGCS